MKEWDALSFNEKRICVSLFPNEALNDKDECIRIEAELYFKLKKLLKEKDNA